jgi:hypothetical protein|tara:strand:+ start:2556 stop:3227 length:672 start_codon:yes stop_codon:yes gene_type:complete
MKNIIMQHYEGPNMPDYMIASVANINAYAERCGAEYKLLDGFPFSKQLNFICQKLAVLNEEYDEYDNIVIVDTDMYERKGQTENIFDVEGIGMRNELQTMLHKKLTQKYPLLTFENGPYWGGAIWKFTRAQRILLRNQIIENEMIPFNNDYNDEGIVHRIATLAGIKQEGTTLPGGFKWCHCSYRPGVEQAAMIHIRPKTTPEGNKRPKEETWKKFIDRGLIE